MEYFTKVQGVKLGVYKVKWVLEGLSTLKGF